MGCETQPRQQIWREHGITVDQVLAKNNHIAEGSESLWRYTETMIFAAANKGYLTKSNN